MRKNIKKIIIYAFIVLFIMISIIYFYPRKISREYNGLMYRLGDSDYSESIKISIDGYLSKGIIKGDKFAGMINIGDVQLQKIKMRFDNVGRGVIFYYEESTGMYNSYGDMFTANQLKEFTICVLEDDEQRSGGKSWIEKDGLMISAAADNRVEALEISNRLMRDVLINKVLR